MSQEVIEIIREMDSEKVENQLILQCAPLIVGLRMSNLFIIHNRHMKQIRFLLRGSVIFYYVIHKTSEKTTILLYNRCCLETYLAGRREKMFLEKAGYTSFCLHDILWGFRLRYRRYRQGEADFPHELGLLLGYPMEDVEGYIKNDGKNSLYTGYWKVYENVSEKLDLFRMFELAKETLIELVNNGVSVSEILEVYSGNQALLL